MKVTQSVQTMVQITDRKFYYYLMQIIHDFNKLIIFINFINLYEYFLKMGFSESKNRTTQWEAIFTYLTAQQTSS